MASYADLPWTKRRAKEVREEFTGGSFGSGDDPIASHTMVAQVSMVQNLEKLMGRQEEGASETTAGLQGEFSDVEIDPTLSYGENAQRIKQAGDGSDFRSNEARNRAADRERTAEEARTSAIEYLVDECMRIEEEVPGGDGVASLRAAGDGVEPAVPGGDQLLDDVDSITDEFGFTVVADAIARCQELSQPDRGIQPDAAGVAEDQLLDRVESILGQRPASTDDALARLEQRIETERDEARQNFLNRLSFAFSSNFESVDEAVDTIRDRVDRLAALNVRVGEIELLGRSDNPPRVSPEAGFGEFQEVIAEQVRDAIDMTAADASITTGRFDAGQIRVVDDEPQIIDLTPLATNDRFRVIDPDALVRRFETAVDLPAVEPETPDTTPSTPEEPAQSEGDRLADQLLEGVDVGR